MIQSDPTGLGTYAPITAFFLTSTLDLDDSISSIQDKEIDRETLIRIALNYRQLPTLERPTVAKESWELFKNFAIRNPLPFQHFALTVAIKKMNEENIDYQQRIQSLMNSVTLFSTAEAKRDRPPTENQK